VDPPDGDTYTHFEILVVYMSPEDLPPEYVRAVFHDNDTVELIPVNLTDDDYRAGVLYHAFVRLSSGDHKIWFHASDGTRSTETETPIKVEVSSYSIEVSDQEWIIILATILATLVIIVIIRTTSQRYGQLKKAHEGLDSEDEVEYIEPGREAAEDPSEEGDADDGIVGDDEKVHVVDTDEMSRLEGEVDRLEEELSDIDGDIDAEEEELAKIDDEIEDIIDELENDRDRAA
jgi:hypothetical protein